MSLVHFVALKKWEYLLKIMFLRMEGSYPVNKIKYGVTGISAVSSETCFKFIELGVL